MKIIQFLLKKDAFTVKNLKKIIQIVGNRKEK